MLANIDQERLTIPFVFVTEAGTYVVYAYPALCPQFAFSSGENYLVGEDSEIKIIITQVGAANTGKHLIVRVSGTLI